MTTTMGVGDEAGNAASKRQPQQMTMLDCASAVVVFKVDYEQAKRLPTGNAVHSDAIPAGGHMWRINFYPGGMRATTDRTLYDRHCIALELLTSDKVGGGVAAMFDAMVLDGQGQPALNSVRRTGKMKNNFYGTFAWLFGPKGVPAEQFVKKYVTTRGYIEFRGTIRVLDVDDDSPNTIPVPPPGIATHLGALLDTADGADVSFTVDGETFRAHRAVVAARSPVLRAEIARCCCCSVDDDAATTTTMPSIALHDIAPATFKDVLRFMYTDALARGEEGQDDDLAGGSSRAKMLECLLAAADRYALDRLKLLCAQKLWDDVSAETVASTLACAQMYNCPELKEKCIGFFAKENNFKKAVLTEGFVELVQQFPSIIIELRDNVAT